jgi:hypothetical protein
VAGAGRQAVPGIQALAGCAIFPRLDIPGHKHVAGAERRGVQAAEDAPLAAVAEHIQSEHMLPDPGRGQDNLLCLLYRRDAFTGALGDLLSEGLLQRFPSSGLDGRMLASEAITCDHSTSRLERARRSSRGSRSTDRDRSGCTWTCSSWVSGDRALRG